MPRKLSRQMFSKTTSTTTLASTMMASSVLPASITDSSLPLPKLIIFDLDYTLWPFWVDTHVSPPLKPNAQHSSASDRFGETFRFYGDVPAILQALPQAGSPGSIRLAVASRTSAPSLARDLLKMLHVPAPDEGAKLQRALDVFDAGLEIYPGSKLRHMEVLQKRTGIPFEDMLFFDDESRNEETERLGLTMRLVRDGITWHQLEMGVEDWRRRRGYATTRT